MGLTQEIRDRHVIILEDIVDTGETAVHLLDELNARQPASISFASLLFKAIALKREVKLDYVGFEVRTTSYWASAWITTAGSKP